MVALLLRATPAARTRERFELVTFGEGGRFSQRNIDKSSALLEVDDVGRFGRRR